MSKKSVLLDKEYILFVLARVSGLVVKPAFIFFLSFRGFDEAALVYAKLLFVLTAVYVVMHIPFHFIFYQQRFSEDSTDSFPIAYHYGKYHVQFSKYLFLISPMIAGLCFAVFREVGIAVMAALFLYGEKLIDEVQRYLQYSKQFLHWSVLFLSKSFGPFLVVVVASYLSGESHLIELFLGVSVTIYLGLTYAYTRQQVNITRLLKIAWRFQTKRLGKTVYLQYFPRFVLTILMSNFLQLDKFYLIFLSGDSKLLAPVTLVSQVGNVMVILNSFVFMSHKRAFYITPGRTVRELLENYKALVTSFSALILLGVGYSIANYFGLYSFSVELSMVLTYFTIFCIFSINSLFIEYLYWNFGSWRLVMIDGGLILAFLAVMQFVQLENIAFCYLLAALTRLTFHLYHSHRISAHG